MKYVARKVPYVKAWKRISNMFVCWFQPGLITHGTVFFSHSKPAPTGLISPETNPCCKQLDKN